MTVRCAYKRLLRMGNAWYQVLVIASCIIAKLGGLLPLSVDTDKTAQSTSQTDNTIVEELVVAKTGKGNQDVAEIAEKLLLGGGALTGDKLVYATIKMRMHKVTYIVMVLLSTTPSPSFRSTFDARTLSCRRVYN